MRRPQLLCINVGTGRDVEVVHEVGVEDTIKELGGRRLQKLFLCRPHQLKLPEEVVEEQWKVLIREKAPATDVDKKGIMLVTAPRTLEPKLSLVMLGPSVSPPVRMLT
jgi:hypothetical protein